MEQTLVWAIACDLFYFRFLWGCVGLSSSCEPGYVEGQLRMVMLVMAKQIGRINLVAYSNLSRGFMV